MASTQQIKRRIRTVKNTKQITKAMELVAASKMRRAQEATLRSRAYRNTAREILTKISELTDVSKHPLYAEREVKSRLYVVVTSDRGLAGAYNANILKAFTMRLKNDRAQGVAAQAILLGKQGARFAAKIEDLNVLGVYENFADNPTAHDIKPILDTVLKEFQSLAVDEVVVLFTNFISSIKQEVEAQTLLPASFVPADSPADLNDVPFEPSPQAVIDGITPRLVEVQLFQSILESQASEHVSRMMAMKSASDNASDLIDDLTLAFNSARQAAITQELAEISGGVEAIA